MARYSGQIRQDDLDDIVDRELKFLSWRMRPLGLYSGTCAPREGQLQLGPDQFFRFETEAGSPTS